MTDDEREEQVRHHAQEIERLTAGNHMPQAASAIEKDGKLPSGQSYRQAALVTVPLLENKIATDEIGNVISGVAHTIEQAEAAGFQRGIEAAVQIADRHADHPTSGDHNNTQAAFDQGMDHRTGAVDNALSIAEAIRALVDQCPAARDREETDG